jgi:hypothetical protein
MEEDFKGFNPDIQLDRAEQASLASTVSQPDLQLFKKSARHVLMHLW